MANLFNTGGVVVQTEINSDEVPVSTPITNDLPLNDSGMLLGSAVEPVVKKDLGESVHSLSTTGLTDYDGNIYHSVIVGNLELIVENLKVTHYADGTPIPNITANGSYPWALPSREDLALMRTNLYLEGVGNFMDVPYWSSTEYDATTAYQIDFSTGAETAVNKSSTIRVRACYRFISSVVYDLGDIGPGGGLIFFVEIYDEGLYRYQEAAASDQSLSYVWSNIDDAFIDDTSSELGSGSWNTENIMEQGGHTTSAAQLCHNKATPGWLSDTEGAYCWYNNNRDYKTPYGALYNFYAVSNVHGLVYFKRNGVYEPGWRVFTTTDILVLIDLLGGWDVAGGKLKETGEIHWNTPNEGATDEIGWKGIGGGNRYIDIHEGDGFGSMHVFGDHLTSEWGLGGEEELAYSYYLEYNGAEISAGAFSKYCGQSIRCIREVA